jgi:hypothetical protein
LFQLVFYTGGPVPLPECGCQLGGHIFCQFPVGFVYQLGNKLGTPASTLSADELHGAVRLGLRKSNKVSSQFEKHRYCNAVRKVGSAATADSYKAGSEQETNEGALCTRFRRRARSTDASIHGTPQRQWSFVSMRIVQDVKAIETGETLQMISEKDQAMNDTVDRFKFNEDDIFNSPFSPDELLDSDEFAEKIAKFGDLAFDLTGTPQDLRVREAYWRKCIEVMIWERNYYAVRTSRNLSKNAH